MSQSESVNKELFELFKTMERENSDQPRALSETITTINQLMLENNDAALAATVSALKDSGHKLRAGNLIDQVCEMREVGVTFEKDGQKQESKGLARLFAIPVVMLRQDAMIGLNQIGGQKLASGFYDHGLVEGDAMVYLNSGLYTYESLNLAPSQRAAIVEKMIGGESMGLPLATPVSQNELALRFIIGVVVTKPESEDIFSQPEGSKFAEKVQAWGRDWLATLQPQFGAFQLAQPSRFSLGLNEGMILLRENALRMISEQAVNRYGEQITTLMETIVSPKGTMVAIRFGEKQKSVTHQTFWPLVNGEALPAAIKTIKERLSTYGISQIKHVETAQAVNFH